MPVILLRHLSKRTEWKAVTGDSFTLGFSEAATVPVPDETLAAHEVRVTRSGDRYLLRDLAEKDRVLLNGVLTREGLLKDGDHIRIGRIAAIFRDDGPGLGEIRFFPGEGEGELESSQWEALEAESGPPPRDQAPGRKEIWKGVPAACLLGTFAAGLTFGILGLRSPNPRDASRPPDPPAAPGVEAPITAPETDPGSRAPGPADAGATGKPVTPLLPPAADRQPPAGPSGQSESALVPSVLPEPGAAPEASVAAPPEAAPAEPPAADPGAAAAADAAPRVVLVAVTGDLARDELSPHSRSAARTLWEIALEGVSVTRVDFSGALPGPEAPGGAALRKLLWSEGAEPSEVLEADSSRLSLIGHVRSALIRVEARGGSKEEVEARDVLLRRVLADAGTRAHVIIVMVPRAGEGCLVARGPSFRSGRIIDQARPASLVRAIVARALGASPPGDPDLWKEALELFR